MSNFCESPLKICCTETYKHVSVLRLPDGVLRPAASLQTLDAFHLDICCDHSGFPSHTSLLAHNRWGHRGTSHDERRRVSETDLFPAFAPQPCQLTQSRARVSCQRNALAARRLGKSSSRPSDGGRSGRSDLMSRRLCNQSDVINNSSDSSGADFSSHVKSHILSSSDHQSVKIQDAIFQSFTD